MRRRWFLLGTVVILLLAGAGAWFLYSRRTAPTPSEQKAPTGTLPGSTGTIPNAKPGLGGVVTTPPPSTTSTQRSASAEEIAKQQALVTAKTFAERYGSYSTDASYQNLESVFPLVTSGYRNSLQQTITKGRTTSSTGFLGVTTRAMSAKVIGTMSLTAPTIVEVLTQRTTTATSTAVSYETLSVSLTHSADKWLVASAQWKTVVVP